jgi:hypothetical protein
MSELSGQASASSVVDVFSGDSDVSSEQVRTFLLENPDFFAQYPELLEKLKFPPANHGRVSVF